MFDQVPDAAIDEATARDLPLIALSREVSFAAVSAQVHEVLTAQRVQSLTREREVELTFSDLLLMGADAVSIAETLAEITDAGVVLENIAHRVVAYVGNFGDIELETWDLHAREMHHEDTGCARRPVVMRGKPWGWIHVCPVAPAHRTAAIFAEERAAAAIAISLLTDRSQEAQDDQRSTALITRLLLGDLNGVEFIEQAGRLGYPLSSERLIVAVANKDPNDLTAVNQSRGQDMSIIGADMGEYHIVITTAEHDRADLPKALGTLTAGGGISREVPPLMLPGGVAQARSAAAVALSLPDSPFLEFDELGVERLLVTLAQGPELANFVEDELGLLLDRDAGSSSPLLPTLRAFLEVDGKKTDAADKLYIQRRTLYNRLDRIATILNKSLDDPASRQSLLLAVKGFDLIGGSPATVRRISRGRLAR